MLTTAARTGDPAAALTSFGPLIDHWHASGSWNQLWLALRALIDTLARHGRHRDVAVLLGAYASSPRATPVYGADSSRLEAAAAAARVALGDEFDDLSAEGRAMTDDGAVLMARRLTLRSESPPKAESRRCWRLPRPSTVAVVPSPSGAERHKRRMTTQAVIDGGPSRQTVARRDASAPHASFTERSGACVNRVRRTSWTGRNVALMRRVRLAGVRL